MATPGNYNNPSLQGADLSEHEKLALEEGHDADLPIGDYEGKTSDDPERGAIEKETGHRSTESIEDARDPQ